MALASSMSSSSLRALSSAAASRPDIRLASSMSSSSLRALSGAPPPPAAGVAHQPDKRLVDQRRRLERVAGALVGELPVRELAQPLVNEGEQRVCRESVAAIPLAAGDDVSMNTLLMQSEWEVAPYLPRGG